MKALLRFAFIATLMALGAACTTVPIGGGTPTPPVTPGKPVVIINSPVSNATVPAGKPVSVQSTSTDSFGIVLVELLVDGKSVQVSPTPNGQPQSQFAVIQTWLSPQVGTHTITVRATNTRAATGEASITLNVSTEVAQASPTATNAIPTATPIPATGIPAPTGVRPTGAPATVVVPTGVPSTAVPQFTVAPTAPPATCILNATFVADVTIPDGTVIGPGAGFTKTWAIQNSGTCAWGAGYNLVFVAGESFGAAAAQLVPPAQPGQTVNVSVNMVAPVVFGPHGSVWQLRASNGALFGQRVDAQILVPGAPTPAPPTPVPGGCSGVPFFNGFVANPANVIQGQSSILSWGLVQNANLVTLTTPGGTQGVATPGSRTVQPNQTTTYTLTARCGNNQVSVSVTVTVTGPACSGAPRFNGFSANPSTIQRGQSTTLRWGLVANATSAVLQTPDGSSGVATPGQLTVSPRRTTTYTLIAYCYNRSAQIQVTVTVQSPTPPTPTPSAPANEIRSIKVEKVAQATWKITVQYFWNGGSSPAVIQGYGTNKNGKKNTNTHSVAILPLAVKYVILNLQVIPGLGLLDQVTVCMIGRGDTELVCRTVRAQ